MTLYRGVIEDNLHPDNNGKVRVRVMGIHTDSKTGFSSVKTEDLPWAEVMMSMSYGYSSGIGVSSVPHQGTHVYVTFFNEDFNQPIVIGSVSGTNTEASSGKGFEDPAEQYPLEDRLNEPDINRLTRVEELSETIHQKINTTLDDVQATDVLSGADVSQIEPNSTNDTSEYPHNNVIETDSGHVIEIDDSADNNRIRIYHSSGTYTEIKDDGTVVTKSVGEAVHTIIEGDLYEHIHKNVKTYIEENVDSIVLGNVNSYIEKSLNEHIALNVNTYIDGNLTEIVKGITTQTYEGNVIETLQADKTSTIVGGLVETIGNFITSVGQKRFITTPQTSHNGNYVINGNLYVTGNISSSGDIATMQKSLNQHKHPGLNVPGYDGVGVPIPL